MRDAIERLNRQNPDGVFDYRVKEKSQGKGKQYDRNHVHVIDTFKNKTCKTIESQLGVRNNSMCFDGQQNMI